jgi:hypothetical protein
MYMFESDVVTFLFVDEKSCNQLVNMDEKTSNSLLSMDENL